MKMFRISAVLMLLVLLAGLLNGRAQGTSFTYQGRLADNGNRANGDYDLQFSILDSNNITVAGPLTNSAVAVSNGIYTVTLDFGGGIFDGRALWLQIGVRTNGSGDDYTLLLPSQPLTAVPYAITAGNVTGGATTVQLDALSNSLAAVTADLGSNTAVEVMSLIGTNDTRSLFFGGSLTLTNSITENSNSPLFLFATSTNISGVTHLMSVVPSVSDTSGTFNLSHEGSWFNGVWDDVTTLGYNQSAGGQRQSTAAPGYWLQWEQYFNQFASPPQAQSEFHLDFVDMNGNSDRPFMYSCDVSNLDNWLEHYVTTSVDYRYPMQGFSNVWLSLAPSATRWTFDADNGVQLTMSDGYTQFNPNGGILGTNSGNQDLLFQGWRNIFIQAYSGGPTYQFDGAGFKDQGTLSVNGQSFFGNTANFSGDAIFNNDFLYLKGKHSTFGQNPMLSFEDNSANSGSATNGRSWAVGLTYYNGGGYGHFTFAVGNQKGDLAYQHDSAVDVLDLASNKVTVTGDLLVSGTVGHAGTANFTGAANFNGPTSFTNTVAFTGPSTFNSPASFLNTVNYSGAASFANAASFGDVVSFLGAANFSGPASFTNSATFAGPTTFSNPVSFSDAVTFSGPASFTNTVDFGGPVNFTNTVNFMESAAFNNPASFSSPVSFSNAVIYSGVAAFGGAASFNDMASFLGVANFGGLANFTNSANFMGPTTFGNPASFSDTANFSNAATFASTATFAGAADFTGPASFTNTMNVTGPASFSNAAIFASGIGSTATNTDSVADTGWTNTTSLTMNVYLDTATNLTLIDGMGNIEFTGKNIWMTSQFRVQPGGMITGTDITGTVHAW